MTRSRTCPVGRTTTTRTHTHCWRCLSWSVAGPPRTRDVQRTTRRGGRLHDCFRRRRDRAGVRRPRRAVLVDRGRPHRPSIGNGGEQMRTGALSGFFGRHPGVTRGTRADRGSPGSPRPRWRDGDRAGVRVGRSRAAACRSMRPGWFVARSPTCPGPRGLPLPLPTSRAPATLRTLLWATMPDPATLR